MDERYDGGVVQGVDGGDRDKCQSQETVREWERQCLVMSRCVVQGRMEIKDDAKASPCLGNWVGSGAIP